VSNTDSSGLNWPLRKGDPRQAQRAEKRTVVFRKGGTVGLFPVELAKSNKHRLQNKENTGTRRTSWEKKIEPGLLAVPLGHDEQIAGKKGSNEVGGKCERGPREGKNGYQGRKQVYGKRGSSVRIVHGRRVTGGEEKRRADEVLKEEKSK